MRNSAVRSYLRGRSSVVLGYPHAGKRPRKYLHDKQEGGLIYTVDEVSVDLGIPRPTVYRYLKEFSIPFSRRSGRIFVPEESVAKVRMVRELHDGGFGTEAVRTRLQQGESTELASITERLDKLTEALESSRLEAKKSVEPAYPSPSAHALRMVLARQTLLISAISNLAEMMGDLMTANGLPRRAVLDYPEVEHAHGHLPLPDRHGRNLVATRGSSAPGGTASGTLARRPNALPSNISHDKFGTLARRRRAVLASSLVFLALLAILIWQLF